MSTNSGRATLATIASAAGVSVATVSKVVNGRPDVAAATRSHIEQVLRDLSYQPRRTDRPRSQAVALLFHGPLTMYSLELLAGVLGEAAESGVDIITARTDIAVEQTRQRIREQGGAEWQAVIAVTSATSELATLSRAHVPTVVIDPMGALQSDMVSVGATNFSGGLVATQHLIELGHRRIAYLGGTSSACNRARLQGYRGALDAAGARIPRSYVRNGTFAYRDGVREGAALLELAQPPTAIFAANDEMALGILEAARTRGIRVPEDLSVVGFDDTEGARVASPPLTTVAQPLVQMGALALRFALRLGSGKPVDSPYVELATQLVVRDSTAPLRQQR